MIKIERVEANFPAFKTYEDELFKAALEKEAHKKCCYCETAHIKGEVEHFRPQGAKLYPWLANELDNLLWSCHDCNNVKGQKLPVKEKKGNAPDSTTECNAKETLIVINPVKAESDEWIFDKTGRMFGCSDIGKSTIEICKLDRENLNDMRLAVLKKLEDDIDSLLYFERKNEILEHLQRVFIAPIQDDKELDFVAFRTYIITHWLEDLLG